MSLFTEIPSSFPSLMAASFRAKNTPGSERAPGGRVHNINMGVYRMCVMLEQCAVKTVSNNFQKLLNVSLDFIHKHGSFPAWPTCVTLSSLGFCTMKSLLNFN